MATSAEGSYSVDLARATRAELESARQAVGERLARPGSYTDRAADARTHGQLQRELAHREYQDARVRLASEESYTDRERDQHFVDAFNRSFDQGLFHIQRHLKDRLLSSADTFKKALTRQGRSVENISISRDWAHPGGYRISATIRLPGITHYQPRTGAEWHSPDRLEEVTIGYAWPMADRQGFPDVRFVTPAERDSQLGVAQSEDNPIETFLDIKDLVTLVPGLIKGMVKGVVKEASEAAAEKITREMVEDVGKGAASQIDDIAGREAGEALGGKAAGRQAGHDPSPEISEREIAEGTASTPPKESADHPEWYRGEPAPPPGRHEVAPQPNIYTAHNDAVRSVEAQRAHLAELVADKDQIIAEQGADAWRRGFASARTNLYNALEHRFVTGLQATHIDRIFWEQARIMGLRTPEGEFLPVPSGRARIADWIELKDGYGQLGELKSKWTLQRSAGVSPSPGRAPDFDEVVGSFKSSSAIGRQLDNERWLVEWARKHPGAKLEITARDPRDGTARTILLDADMLKGSRVTDYTTHPDTLLDVQKTEPPPAAAPAPAAPAPESAETASLMSRGPVLDDRAGPDIDSGAEGLPPGASDAIPTATATDQGWPSGPTLVDQSRDDAASEAGEPVSDASHTPGTSPPADQSVSAPPPGFPTSGPMCVDDQISEPPANTVTVPQPSMESASQPAPGQMPADPGGLWSTPDPGGVQQADPGASGGAP
ncbi:hypothetical protein [Streptomyces sp. NPDC127197]|uniref:hypothetical protein n=1 Tax=Streptomyces sp. NPDC127197 TaxID=3345388 RepID=UPI0036368D46